MSDKDKKHIKSANKSFLRIIQGMLFGQNKANLSVLEEEILQSPIRTIVRNFFSNKIAVIGLIIFVLIFISCFTLSAIFPLDASYQDTTQQNISPGLSIMKYPKELNGNVGEISIGSTFSAGIDKQGKAYIWGNASENLRKIPQTAKNLKSISAGLDHILAIDNNGKVITWGTNRFKLDRIPEEVKMSNNIKQVEAAYQYSLALTEDGFLYFWGNGNLVVMSQEFITDDIQGKVKKVVGNTSNIILLLEDGTIKILGSKGTTFYKVPDEAINIVDVATGDKAAIALDASGKIYIWGGSEYNLLQIPEGIQGKVESISAGRFHFNVITTDGNLYSWGSNNFNQTNIAPNIKNIKKIYAGYFQNYAVDNMGKITTWGLKGYLFGTDGYGRDIVTRLISGGRLTLTVGAVAVLISTVLGIIVGGIAGFYGGVIDMLLMRFAEIVGSIPFLPLAMTLSAVVGNSISEVYRIMLIMLILGILSWSGLAQLVRGQILAEREKEFVTAAKAMGIKERNIIFKHILPNVITVIIVSATLSYATSLLTESSLSFLGFGVVEPNPTWGNMLTGSQSSTIVGTYWWRWVFPSLALALSTISINLLGDGLRDAIDPKSNER